MEIGSEFHIEISNLLDNIDNREIPKFGFDSHYLYLLSGRTAIDIICRDILASRRVQNVYMPSYCCSSMIMPFIENGINVLFYDVRYIDGGVYFDIDTTASFDLLYITNYFGFDSFPDLTRIEKLKEQGSIIIYDRTHSLYKDIDPVLQLADYAFASIRKWVAITSGAIVWKRSQNFDLKNLRDCPYTENKLRAQILKSSYLKGDKNVKKNDFYTIFGSFDDSLKNDYVGYKIDPVSMRILRETDFERIKEQRRQNALIYYNELSGCNGIRFLFDSFSSDETPLFVPIIVDEPLVRLGLRQELIQNQIYCPIHWSKHEWIGPESKSNELYDKELSLVCDQRYNVDDMGRVIKVVKNYLNNKL